MGFIGAASQPGGSGGGGGSSTITSLLGITSKGQAVSANSLPVVLASDQSSIPVTGAFYQATQPVSGTLTVNLITGFATSANQTNKAQITQVADGSGNIIGSTSNALNVNISSGNISGFATSANQTNKAQITQIADGSGNIIGSTSNALNVNVTTSSLAVTQSTSPWVVGQATGSNLHTVVDSGTVTTVSTVTNVTELNGVGPTFNSTTYTSKQGLDINILGSLGTAFTTAGYVSTMPSAVATTVGPTVSYQSALSNTKTQIKGTAGNLYGYHFYNSNTSVAYMQVWNLASGSVTVGSTAPTFVLVIPAGGWLDDVASSVPIYNFTTALTVAITTTASGSTAMSNTCICDFFYQ